MLLGCVGLESQWLVVLFNVCLPHLQLYFFSDQGLLTTCH